MEVIFFFTVLSYFSLFKPRMNVYSHSKRQLLNIPSENYLSIHSLNITLETQYKMPYWNKASPEMYIHENWEMKT